MFFKRCRSVDLQRDNITNICLVNPFFSRLGFYVVFYGTEQLVNHLKFLTGTAVVSTDLPALVQKI